MSEYWPEGIELGDIASPIDILNSAKEQWEAESNGVLTLVLHEAESTDGNIFVEVHAKYIPTDQTITLFAIVYRPGSPYPSRIQPSDEELPDYFKKSYKRSGIADIATIVGAASTTEVTNQWVCDTPGEFRVKLKSVFNLGTLKSQIVSLISRPKLSDGVEGEANDDSEQEDIT